MGLPDLYPAQVGSPYTTLAAPYTTGEATMTVVDATKLPTAPNIVCLAGNVAGEFSYTGKEGNVLQGVTALPGTSAATTWPVGTYAFRGIAAYDLNAIHENMVRTAGTAGQVLASTGAGALPAWADRPKRGAYDAIVYKSGTSVIAEDATGATIASGTAGTDDSAVIQAAVNRKGNIYIAGGSYSLATTLTLYANTRLFGSANTAIYCPSTVPRAIYMTGRRRNENTAIPTVDIVKGMYEIPCNDASAFAPGDYILITSDYRHDYLNAPYGEFRRIVAINGNTLLVDPIEFRYNLVDNPTIVKYDLVSGIAIENLEIYSDDGTARTHGIQVDYANGVVIRDVHVHDFGSSNIYIQSSINVTVERCECHGSLAFGVGYGIAIGNASRDITVKDCRIYGNGNHAVTIGGSSSYGYPTHIRYTNNYFSNTGGRDSHTWAAADSHYGGVVIYENNTFDNVGYGIWAGADTVIVTGCTFSTGDCAIKSREKACLLRRLLVSNCKFDTTAAGVDIYLRQMDDITITGCQFKAITGYGISITKVGFESSTSPNITISGNSFQDISDDAIRVKASTGDGGNARVACINISGNSVNSCGGAGIYCRSGINTIISNNIIINSGTSDSTTNSAIYGRAREGGALSIADNIICNFHTTGITAIVDTGCAGCSITGNTISGFANEIDRSRAIAIEGTGTFVKIHNNIITDTNAAYAIHQYRSYTPAGIITDNYFAPTLDMLLDGNVPNTFRNNIGYVTENSGAAATVADGGTIAHGCVKAPTKVTLTGSVAGEIVTVTSINATNITVAIKKPDGSAGTTQTIYWRAEV